jgi:hypothetical protein
MRRWLPVFIGGQRWSVLLCSPRSKHLKKDGCKCVGICNYEKNKIYISSELNSEAREDTLLHEVLHALLHVTGAEAAYDGDAGKDEDLVKALTPALHRLLKDLGFKFPKGPDQ